MTITRRMVLGGLAASFGASGCFGGFALTRKLWRFNEEISDNKFVEWLVFLVLIIIPVYEIFTFVDALIFNSLEFWTGSNPLADGTVPSSREKLVQLSPNETLRLTFDPEKRAMTVEVLRDGEVVFTHVFEAIDGGVIMQDAAGNPIASATKRASGDVDLLTENGSTFVPASEFARAVDAHRNGGLRGLLAERGVIIA
jgi:hypothetical protein